LYKVVKVACTVFGYFTVGMFVVIQHLHFKSGVVSVFVLGVFANIKYYAAVTAFGYFSFQL
jgi:hypothetical protein